MRKCFLILLLTVLPLSAEELEVNGGFERVVASQTGQLMPEGWLLNKPVSKNCIVLVTKNPAEVRNGNFALWLEGDGN